VFEQILKGSYFSIGSPLQSLERWLYFYCHHQTIVLQGKNLRVEWTDRADRALRTRSEPLIVEMQLYFSCVVKKRVVFHEAGEMEAQVVNDSMRIMLRAIQAAACNPEEFAKNYPLGRILKSPAATKMIPGKICIDFRRGDWEGEFDF